VDDGSACFHCGEPNPQPERWRAVIDGTAASFCCAGCLAIAQTIHAAGLDAFYAQRTVPADRPVDDVGDDDEWSR
jgi:Cu2+-exporting ATPase